MSDTLEAWARSMANGCYGDAAAARRFAQIADVLAAAKETLGFYSREWEYWRSEESADGGEGYAPSERLVADHGCKATTTIAKLDGKS